MKEGQDKHAFMEQMVSDTSIQKVLVICDGIYQSKGNDRKGGVGTESQLISKEVYDNTAQEKFIPIVKEYDKDGKPCIPHYMASRIYIDLSKEDSFEENYQLLVRNLYNKPELKRPPLGTPPAYITEDDPIVLKTSHKVQEIKNALLNGRSFANALISDYYDVFLNALEDFKIVDSRELELDDVIVKSIERLTALRDDFIEFTLVIFKYQGQADLDTLKEFFEKLLTYIPSSNTNYDNFRFFCYELMLYFMAILFKLKKYGEAAFFIETNYLFKRDQYSEITAYSIDHYNRYVRSLDESRNKRLQSNKISITADLIKERATRKDITFEDIKSTDLILYCLREISEPYPRFPWFPRTIIYFDGHTVELFGKMASVQHFEKVKVLFDVNTKDELKVKLDAYIERRKNGKATTFNNWDYDIPALERVIAVDKVATFK